MVIEIVKHGNADYVASLYPGDGLSASGGTPCQAVNNLVAVLDDVGDVEVGTAPVSACTALRSRQAKQFFAGWKEGEYVG